MQHGLNKIFSYRFLGRKSTGQQVVEVTLTSPSHRTEVRQADHASSLKGDDLQGSDDLHGSADLQDSCSQERSDPTGASS